MAEPLILALDEGAASTRAILFDAAGRPLPRIGRPIVFKVASVVSDQRLGGRGR